MHIGQKSFLFFIFFIFGVLLFSLDLPLTYICLGEGAIFLCSLFTYLFKSDKRILSFGFLTLSVVAGAFYAGTYEYINFGNISLPTDREVRINGVVDSYPQASEKTKSMVIKTEREQIYVRMEYFSQINYGDSVTLEGNIKPLDEKTDYLKKYNVTATLDYPKIISLRKNASGSLYKTLYSVRDSFGSVFSKTLGQQESALMAGILLGQESANFPADFKQAMKNSGTTHITALSGYNITILIAALFFILSFIFPRTGTFWVSIAGIVLFVLMTGAQSSVVRAAFMGSLVIVARQLSRIYSFKQAMAVSAFVMVLINPMILRFDLGFILSFLSLAGIAYIAPIADSFITLKIELADKIKKLFLETLSAQAAVLPVLAVYFGGFSVVGLISNVLILPLIPWTMFIGFFVGLAGILWMPLAQIFSIILSIPLKFEVSVINFFGSFNQVQAEFGLIALTVYYLLILAFVFGFKNRLEAKEYVV
jgi:competence protein ComEC